MNVLFVCYANLNRSPRAAEVFRKLADQKGLDIEIQSAGTDAWAREKDPETLSGYGVKSVTQLTNEMLKKADIVIALDLSVMWDIKNNFQTTPRRIIDLGIEDKYSLGSGNLDTLYEILNKKLEPLAEELSLSLRPPNKEAL
jgi:protein-tyrosine-phosphatase